MQSDHLATLVAVVDNGTFELAARRLHITPSAVSQRIKALENEIGQIVIRRAVPCRPTSAGEVLLRMARQLLLLQGDALSELKAGAQRSGELPVAVNADSLATWLRPLLGVIAEWPDTELRLYVEDQDHSIQLLRSGEVIGAITSDPVAVHGCSIEYLGSMRYLPVATAALRSRFAKGRGVDWAAIPAIRFNAKDDVQQRVLNCHGVLTSSALHQVPSSEGFLDAVRAGLGWGAVPTHQLGDELSTGALVRLGTRDHIDVPLYWQVWRLQSPRITRLTDAIRTAAEVLRRSGTHRQRPVNST